MYELVISDLDGTLLNSEKDISEETVKCIKEIQNKGIQFAILSGRQYKAIKPIMDKHKLNCHVIGLNGGEFVDANGNSNCEVTITNEDILKVINICEKEKLVYQLCNNSEVISKQLLNEDDTIKAMVDLSKLHGGDAREILKGAVLYYNIIYNDSIQKKNVIKYLGENEFKAVKIVVLGPSRKQLNKITEEIESVTDLNVASSHMSNIEITHKDVHKGRAVKKLAEDLDINIDKIIGIGDNLNDLPLLENVGLSVAMNNASIELKNKVKYVTKNNDEDGVAHVLKKFILD